MNPPAVVSDVLTQFSLAPGWVHVLAKSTLLLASAWLVHFGLARANPRWRLLLWRAATFGVVLLAIWTLGLPRLEIRIRSPRAASPAPAPAAVAPPIAAVKPVDQSGEFADSIRLPTTMERAMRTGDAPSDAPTVEVRPVEATHTALSWPTVLLGIWGCGLALLAVRLAILMLSLSLAPIFCWAAEPNADQAKAIAEIEKLGGRVTIDEESPGKPVISVDYKNTQVTDAALVPLKGLRHLQGLDLGGTKVTDAGLAHLKALTNLQSLDLAVTEVTDAWLVNLNGLNQLHKLSLSATHVTDGGLANLKGLTQLQTLDLEHTRVTDAGLERLKGAASQSI